MKKTYLIFLVFSIFQNIATAQEKIEMNNISLDLLKMPTSPAFLLMDTSPTEIAEPGSTPEFIVSVQNASNNFSGLPNNYSFTVTPYWWGKKAKSLKFKEEFDTNKNPWRPERVSLSAGIVKGIGENDSLWRYGVGIRVPLLAGKVNKEAMDNYLTALKDFHNDYNKHLSEFRNKNPQYADLEKKINDNFTQSKKIGDEIKMVIEDATLNDDEKKNRIAKLEKSLTEIMNEYTKLQGKSTELKKELDEKFSKEYKLINKDSIAFDLDKLSARYGLKWDVSGGLALNAQNNKTNATGIYRIGVWSDLGYTFKPKPNSDPKLESESTSAFSVFFLARYLFYNEINYEKDEVAQLLNDVSLVDFGAKLKYDFNNKFSLSAEALLRTASTNNVYDTTYKLNGLMQYKLQKNRMVYLSVGNNFNDNNNYAPEDLVVTVGINLGFGDNINLYQ